MHLEQYASYIKLLPSSHSTIRTTPCAMAGSISSHSRILVACSWQQIPWPLTSVELLRSSTSSHVSSMLIRLRPAYARNVPLTSPPCNFRSLSNEAQYLNKHLHICMAALPKPRLHVAPEVYTLHVWIFAIDLSLSSK